MILPTIQTGLANLIMTALFSLNLQTATTPAVITVSPETPTTTQQSIIQDKIRETFSEDQTPLAIAKCESGFTQFKNGTTTRGLINSHDIGVFQINEIYHADDARKLGFNIYEADGNIAYAKYLYDTQGSKPWAWSKDCWAK